MTIANLPAIRACRPAWNKGRVVGQKRPLMPKHVWAIRVRLEIAENHRDLALFNLAIDSKLRGCDLVKLKVADILPRARSRKGLRWCCQTNANQSQLVQSDCPLFSAKTAPFSESGGAV